LARTQDPIVLDATATLVVFFSAVPIIFKGPGFYVTDNTCRGNAKFDRKRNGNGPKGEAKSATSSKENKAETIS